MTIRHGLNAAALSALGALGVLPRAASAQSATGVPAVDSAAVARAAYARGTRAMRTDSLDAAQREMAHATAAWPTQPAYSWALAIVAAARRDTATTLRALDRTAALGAARPVRNDGRFAFLSSMPRFVTLAAALDSLSSPAPRSTIFATVSDTSLWPEGVDCIATGDTCWLTSIAHRNVFVVTRQASARALVTKGAPLPGPVTAVRYDPRRDRLWVATSSGIGPAPRDGQRAILALVNPHTQSIEATWQLPGPDTLHVLGDLALSAGGDVLVSDSQSPTLFLLPHGQSALVSFTHPLFRSLQGVAFVPGTSFAVVADYSHGLLRVDLRTHAVRRVDDAVAGSSLGLDGIAWYRGTVIGVQNGFAPPRVVQFTFDPALARVTGTRELDRNLGIADEPTSGSIVGDAFVYVANSSWDKHDANGARVPGTRLTTPVLLRLPLPARSAVAPPHRRILP